MSLVLYEKKGKVAYITLNRPDKMNALSQELCDELEKAWLDFRDDDELWVAILSGNGKAFCAGADLSGGRRKRQIASASWLSSSPALRSVPTNYDIWKPIIGALHGYVLGAGLWLAMGCDLRIAAEDAEFGAPEPLWNIPTTVSAPFLYYMAPTLAHEILLVGDRISAQRAYQGCLVNKVVTREEVMPACIAMAERLCENGPMAVRAMKEVLLRGRDLDYAGKMALTEHVFGRVRLSQDWLEGRHAFAEKRKPVWKGM